MNQTEQLSLHEFWQEVHDLVNLPLDYGESEEDSINKKLVSCMTLISSFSTYHEFESQQLEFEFYYKLTKKLFAKQEFSSNITFCVRKLLSLVDYLIANDAPYISYYSQNPAEEMDLACIEYLDANSRMMKVVSFLLLIHYKLNHSIISILQEFQGFDIISKVLVDNYKRSKCPNLHLQESTYKNFMELLYEFCKNVKLSSLELNSVDDSFIHYLLESIRGLTKIEDESNFYKFKIVIILNEQYMVNFYEQQESETGPCENKIFMTLLDNEEYFRNFIDCLILNFNRETDDHVIQILILKILYLIFTTSMTCQKFYLNDLKVLTDIFLRELSNLSIHDNQVPLVNTYLRVLYPMLLFSQLKSEKYKFKYLLDLSEDLLKELDDEDAYKNTMRQEDLEEIPTSKRLVLRILKFLNHDLLRTDSVSSEISNHSATNLNKLSSKSLELDSAAVLPQDHDLPSGLSSRSSSVVSLMSSQSNGSARKIPPPIPLPRKALYKADSASEISFAYSPTASRR